MWLLKRYPGNVGGWQLVPGSHFSLEISSFCRWQGLIFHHNFSATGGGHESLLGTLGDDEVAFIDGAAHKHSSAPKVAGAYRAGGTGGMLLIFLSSRPLMKLMMRTMSPMMNDTLP